MCFEAAEQAVLRARRQSFRLNKFTSLFFSNRKTSNRAPTNDGRQQQKQMSKIRMMFFFGRISRSRRLAVAKLVADIPTKQTRKNPRETEKERERVELEISIWLGNFDASENGIDNDKSRLMFVSLCRTASCPFDLNTNSHISIQWTWSHYVTTTT